MFNIQVSIPDTPLVNVLTSSHRGHTPEELAKLCADKLISVSDSAHPAIREQAKAYQNAIIHVVTSYMKEAVTNDRVTVYNALVDAGHPQLADAIRKL
jgi:TRAP-type uncharacterized transport system substrate-binding protein